MLDTYFKKFLIPLALSLGGFAQAGELVDQCADCHGRSGTSLDAHIPVIGGVSAFYLQTAMEVYAEEGRGCPNTPYPAGSKKTGEANMCDVAKALSAQDIEQLSAHYAAQTYTPVEQTTDANLAAKGQRLHEQRCAKCHSDNGGVAEDDAGILAGQPMDYLSFSFEDFRSGNRPTLKSMQKHINALSPDEVVAMLHFYASQKGPAE